ncbi:MAG: hypothetical protein DLM59_04550 [Pseudonocardiales bacterium]|nr:MAG: hypothetical protein DLM59_04550 [Pseudonocardiales bacterium]
MRLMSPEDYLREVDHQLGQILRPTGFDPDAIIATVIVNRWPHTYSPTLNTLTDDSVSYASEMLLSRQPFGRIAIASVDSHRFGWAQAAVDAVERAANELPSGGRQMRFDEH